MQEIPQEAPLMTRWRDYLRNMHNCSYAVDGVAITFTHHEIFPANDTIVLYTTARHHTVKLDDMPEYLRHWVPVEEEGMPYFNHIWAEAGVVVPANSKLPAPITPEDHMKALYLKTIEDLLNDMESIRENLKAATLNIKDPKSGVAGQNFINQANQIANLNDKRIKNNASLIQAFGLLHKMVAKGKDKGEKDG